MWLIASQLLVHMPELHQKFETEGYSESVEAFKTDLKAVNKN